VSLIRKLALAIVSTAFLVSGNSAFAQEGKPSGTISIDERQVSLLIGGSSGHGVLKFGGKTYKFKTEGVKVGAVGVSKVRLEGEVYNLKNSADFPGYYSAAQAGATLVKGLDGFWLSNDKGVKIRFAGKSEGVAVQLGFSALKFTME